MDDDALLQGWHEARLAPESRALLQIGSNLVQAEKSLPETSPAHTAILQATTIGTISSTLTYLIDQVLKALLLLVYSISQSGQFMQPKRLLLHFQNCTLIRFLGTGWLIKSMVLLHSFDL